GHTPHAQGTVPEFERGQVVAVGAKHAEPTARRLDRGSFDVSYLPVVRNTADADDPPVVDTCPEPVLRVEAPCAESRQPGTPARPEADVRESHGGDGLVAQPLVGADGRGLGNGVQALQALPHLAAETAGTGLFVERAP